MPRCWPITAAWPTAIWTCAGGAGPRGRPLTRSPGPRRCPAKRHEPPLFALRDLGVRAPLRALRGEPETAPLAGRVLARRSGLRLPVRAAGGGGGGGPGGADERAGVVRRHGGRALPGAGAGRRPLTACIACGQPGRRRRVTLAVLANAIDVDDVLCEDCHQRVLDCRRFLVFRVPGGWEVAAVDEQNQPLLRRREQ